MLSVQRFPRPEYAVCLPRGVAESADSFVCERTKISKARAAIEAKKVIKYIMFIGNIEMDFITYFNVS